MSEITRILERAQQGDAQAAAELLPLVYDELRWMAAAGMAHELPGQTLQPTTLVLRRGFGLSAKGIRNGMAARISSVRPPRRCAAFSSRGPRTATWRIKFLISSS
jgi:hypothetical protein